MKNALDGYIYSPSISNIQQLRETANEVRHMDHHKYAIHEVEWNCTIISLNKIGLMFVIYFNPLVCHVKVHNIP